jgi:perosamine synthetase
MIAINSDIARNLLPESSDLHAVMERLNAGIQGIVLLIDDDGRLTGVMTDGDVRRAILAGASLTSSARCHMSRRFVAGQSSRAREENLSLLTERCRHVPVLDDEGRPLEILSWAQLWKTALVNPSLSGNEIKYVLDCLTSGWISSAGAYVGRFEKALAELHGSRGAIACSSGTAALHLALLATGIGPGDEVIVPSFTFGATANAVVQVGATPVFVDVDSATWTMTAESVSAAATERTRAVIPVHIYGHPANMPAIMQVARDRGLHVIEDVAEAMTARVGGQLAGTFGHIGCYSFFSNKIMTTGEGGALISSDEALLDRIALFRDHGMRKSRRYWHEVSGLNYRMTNLQAAIGLAQMERLGRFRAHRDRLRATYESLLGGVHGVTLMPCANWADPVNWLYTVLLEDEGMRQAVAERLHVSGIETRRTFAPLHDQPAFADSRVAGAMSVSDDLHARGLSLPTGNTTDEAEARRVGELVRETVELRRSAARRSERASA